MNNIIIYKNTKIINKNLIQKFKIIYNIFLNYYISDYNLQVCDILVNKLHKFDNLNNFLNKFKTHKYNINGLKFIPLNSKFKTIYFYLNKNYYNKNNYLINYSKNNQSYNKAIIKSTEILNNLDKLNKISIENNLNNKYNKILTFSINKNKKLPNIYELYYSKENKLIKLSNARINNIECAMYMNNIFKNQNNILIDCKYCKNFNKWIPLKISNKKVVCNYNDLKFA